ERAIDKRQSAVDILKKIGMSMSCPAKSYGIVRSNVGRSLNDLRDFLLVKARSPAISLREKITRGGQPIRGRKIAILFDGSVKELQRFRISLPCPSVPAVNSAEVEIVCSEVTGGTAFCAVDFRFFEVRRDCPYDPRHDLIL